jgi:antitoxin MazE
MITKLEKHGDGWALVLDAPVVDQLQLDPETPLEITVDGNMLIVAPVGDENRRKKFEAALQECNDQYGRALKKLGE